MERNPSESPFPKGMTIYDDDSDEDNNESDEIEGGYEVICSREVQRIPHEPHKTAGQSSHKSQTVIGQGASYMMGTASRLLGSLFTK